jgi:hypothetical protein
MNLQVGSFDTAMDAFETGGNKAAERELQKQEKFDQMSQKIAKMKSDNMKQRQKITRSVLNPREDTIQFQLDLFVMEKEYEIAQALFAAMFPEE